MGFLKSRPFPQSDAFGTTSSTEAATDELSKKPRLGGYRQENVEPDSSMPNSAWDPLESRNPRRRLNVVAGFDLFFLGSSVGPEGEDKEERATRLNAH